MNWKLLLVPHDFSPSADRAETLAAELSRLTGARVELLHVVELPSGLAGSVLIKPEGVAREVPLEAHVTEAASAALEERASRLRGRGIDARASVAVGSAVETILAHARKGRVGAIVMGTHGRTGLSRFLMGSVAERVVRAADVPVMTIREEGEGAGVELAPAPAS